jgi:molybdopterin-guanine dinucleotide biosynthesis protein A
MTRLPVPLPVHGFVLAGGKSSRMGEDKALLRFRGRPMVEIAAEKLRGVCAEVGIAGNREDLAGFAPVVPETRVEVGPAAGVEAGLRSAAREWVMFVPVDVPLVPEALLRRWAESVLGTEGISASLLHYERDQPVFCMMRRDCTESFSAALDGGERRLGVLLDRASGGLRWVCDVGELCGRGRPAIEVDERWFWNVNTPQELAEAEAWVDGRG